MKLAELQTSFFEWVTGPADVPNEETAHVIYGGALTPAVRVGIYAEMYWLRMRDVLRNDFPRSFAVMGEAAFDAAIASYLQKHASQHPSLGQLGHAFAAHLAPHGWVADLAHMEWLRGQAFVAPDAPVISMSDMSSLPSDQLPEARLRFAPSVALAELRYDVLPRLTDDDATPSERAVQALVWRRDFTVFHAEVSAAEAVAVRAVLKGATVTEACAPFDDAAQAFAAIGSWVNEGLVASVEVGGVSE